MARARAPTCVQPVLLAQALFFVCTGASACTLALSYPNAANETDALCDDGHDDDLDSLVDCADPSCDGTAACRESSRELCRDGRDNDADGRRDQEDIGCWPFVRANVTRCESIGPSSFDGSFRGLAGGWSGEGATLVLDDDDPAGDVATAAPPVGERVVLLGPPMAGALAGGRLQTRIRVGPTSRVLVGFVVAGADLRAGQPDGLLVSIDSGGVSVAGSDQSVAIPMSALALDEPRWVDVELRMVGIDDGPEAWEVTLDGATHRGVDQFHAFRGRERGRVPSVLATGRALRAAWMVRGEGALGRTSARLGRSDPCGYAVPQIPTTIRGLARGPDGLCAIAQGRAGSATSEARDAFGWSSRDDGRTFTPVAPLAGVGGLYASGASIVVHDGAYAGLLALTRPSVYAVSALMRLEGATCGSLRSADLDLLFPTNLHPSSPAYDVATSASGDVLHRVSLIRYNDNDVTGAATVNLTVATSRTGAPGTFTLTSDQPLRVDVAHELYAGVQLLSLGADRAIVLATDRGIDVIVEQPDGLWQLADAPLLAPSGVVGTFDQLLVSSPTLVLDPPAPQGDPPRLTGLVAFTGASCASGPGCDLPTAVLPIELRPPE